VLGPDFVFGEHDRLLDGVLQLARVARVAVGLGAAALRASRFGLPSAAASSARK
jgi:hypothetical protein